MLENAGLRLGVSGCPLLVGLCLAGMFLAGVFLSLPWWVFASVAGGLGLTALCLLKPKAGWWCMLAVFFVATPSVFFYPDSILASLFLVQILLLPTLVGSFLQAVARREPFSAGTSLWPLLLMVLGLHGAAWFWTPAPEFGLFNLGTIAINLLLFWCVVHHLRTAEDLRLLCWALFVGGILCATGVTLSQWWEPDWKYWDGTYWGVGFTFFVGRQGGFVASNHAASYLLTASFAAAGLWVGRRSRPARLGLLLGAGYFLYAIVLTQSRGALMALIAAAFAVLFLNARLRPRFFKHCLTVLIFVLCCVAVAQPGYIDRILIGFGYSGELLFSEKPENADEEMENISGMSARFKMWKHALRVMQAEPALLLAGLGPGGFVSITKEPEVHSIWLAFFFDLGLPGVVMQIAIWIWLISHFRRLILSPLPPDVAPLCWAMLAACLGELGVHGLIDHDLTSMVSRFTFLFFALAAGTIKVADRRLQEEHGPCLRKHCVS